MTRWYTVQTPERAPAATGEQAIYPDSAALDPKVNTSSGRRPLTVRGPAGAQLYKPFHYVLLVYLFLYCSRIPELFPSVHTGWVLQPILLVGMIITGRMAAIWRLPLGKVMIAFTCWVALGVPFSFWRGGSFTIFILVLQALVLMAFMAAFVQTIPDCLRVMYTVGLAAAAIGILSLVIGGGRAGSTRLGLGSGVLTLSDANILCLYIIISLPFLWLSASLKTGFEKILLMSLTLPMLAAASRTGSRMGLLALVAGLVLYLIFSSAKQRLLVITGGIVFLMLAPFFTPQDMRERFLTYFHARSAAAEEAAQSAEARKELLIRSLEMTAEHPFLGVGPGEFMDAEAQEARDRDQRALWHLSHNSYTELSSETGIVGLVLFTIALFGAYKGLSPIRNKNPSRRVRRAALFTQMAVLIGAVSAFFLSIAYGNILAAVIAISATLQAAVANQTKLDRAS